MEEAEQQRVIENLYFNVGVLENGTNNRESIDVANYDCFSTNVPDEIWTGTVPLKIEISEGVHDDRESDAEEYVEMSVEFGKITKDGESVIRSNKTDYQNQKSWYGHEEEKSGNDKDADDPLFSFERVADKIKCIFCRAHLDENNFINTSPEEALQNEKGIETLCELLLGSSLHPFKAYFQEAGYCNECQHRIRNVNFSWQQLMISASKVCFTIEQLKKLLQNNYNSIPEKTKINSPKIEMEDTESFNCYSYDEVIKMMIKYVSCGKSIMYKSLESLFLQSGSHKNKWLCDQTEKTLPILNEEEPNINNFGILDSESLNCHPDSEDENVKNPNAKKRNRRYISSDSTDSNEDDGNGDINTESKHIISVGQQSARKRKQTIISSVIELPDFDSNHAIFGFDSDSSSSSSNSKLDPNIGPIDSNITSSNGHYLPTNGTYTDAPKTKNKSNCEYQNEYKCKNCKNVFKSKHLLDTHVRKDHEGDPTPYHCKISGCEAKYSKYDHMWSHHKNHSRRLANIPKEYPFYCSMCGLGCDSDKLLQNHIKIHEGVNPFICEPCQKEFLDSVKLRHHIKKIHLESNVQCNVCGRYYTCTEKLEKHMEVHSRNHVMKKCEICPAEFVTVKSLKQHLRNHSAVNCVNSDGQQNKIPYQCDTCGRTYKNKLTLNVHINSMHTGERRVFKCTLCNKESFSKNTILRHEALHSGLKTNVICELCGVSCTDKYTLKRHVTRFHSGECPKRKHKLKQEPKFYVVKNE